MAVAAESTALTELRHQDPEKHLIGESLPAPSRIISSGSITVGTSPIAAREDHYHGGGAGEYVDVTGDTMTGKLTISNSSEALVLKDSGAYIAFFNGGTREGYIQGVAGGLTINSETGPLTLSGTGNGTLVGKVNGYTISEGVTGYRIVATGVNGYIFGNYINMTANVEAGWPSQLAGQNGDGYLRWYNKAGSYPSTFTAVQCIGTSSSLTYTDTAVYSNPGATAAAHSWHPGGIAIIGGCVNGGGNSMYFRNYLWQAGTANLHAANFSTDSSRRWKKNINPYPLAPVGAGVPRVTDIVSKLNPVTYERSAPETEVPSDRRFKALQRLNKFRANRDIDDYILPVHDCSVHECNGTAENPCSRIINSQHMWHGFVAEDVYEVIPEVVHLDIDRQPAGVDLGQMLSISVAAIKELIDRITVLEEAVANA